MKVRVDDEKITKFTQKWLEFELSNKNNMFDPLYKLFKSKGRKLTDLRAIIIQG